MLTLLHLAYLTKLDAGQAIRLLICKIDKGTHCVPFLGYDLMENFKNGTRCVPYRAWTSVNELWH